MSHPESHFADMYAHNEDPWGIGTGWYETRKRQVTLALLPEQRYRSALEAGCGNGDLTELLAPRCERLVAYDLIPDAVDRTTARMQDQTHVTVMRGRLPDCWPGEGGDLVVWSEVAYYLDDDDASRAHEALREWLSPGGTLLSVHYRLPTNYPRTADEVEAALDALPWLERTTTLVDPKFLAGSWTRR